MDEQENTARNESRKVGPAVRATDAPERWDELPKETPQLGFLTAVFAPGKTMNVVGITTGFLMLTLGCVLIICGMILQQSDPVILGAVLDAIGILVSWSSWLNMRLRVGVYTEGILYREGRNTKVFLWKDIQSIWQDLKIFYVYVIIPFGTSYAYTLQRRDGVEIVLNDRLANVNALGGLIQSEMTRLLLPRAIQAVESGRTLEFGRLIVNRAEIRWDNYALPWEKVKSIQVQNGNLLIDEKGAFFHWKSIALSEIPNVFVLLALVDHIAPALGKGA